MDINTALSLVDACKTFTVAAAGPSGDAEHDAAVDMRDAALELLRSCAACYLQQEGDGNLAAAIATYDAEIDEAVEVAGEYGDDEDEVQL